MKLAIAISLVLGSTLQLAAASARQLNDPTAGFSITIPDQYQYEPEVIDIPDVYPFVEADPAGGFGTAIFLKHLGFASLRGLPASPAGAVVVTSASWHGSKLSVFKAAGRLKGAAVISYRVRVSVRDGILELIVLGSPDQNARLAELLATLLSTVDVLRTPSKATLADPAGFPLGTQSNPSTPLVSTTQVPLFNVAVANGQTQTKTQSIKSWLGVQPIARLGLEFGRQFGLQLACVYVVTMLIVGRLFRARLGLAICVWLAAVALLPTLVLGVPLRAIHVTLPYRCMPFAAMEVMILLLGVWACVRRARLQSRQSLLYHLSPEDLAIHAPRPGASNRKRNAAEQLAADTIRTDDQMPDHEKLIYWNALDSLTEADLTILETFAAGKRLPVSDLAQGIPEPRTEESLGGLISSLRRLEAYGLVLITMQNRRKKTNSYLGVEDVGINRWLSKEATILPRGQKLIQLLKDCRAKILTQRHERAEYEGPGATLTVNALPV